MLHDNGLANTPFFSILFIYHNVIQEENNFFNVRFCSFPACPISGFNVQLKNVHIKMDGNTLYLYIYINIHNIPTTIIGDKEQMGSRQPIKLD